MTRCPRWICWGLLMYCSCSAHSASAVKGVRSEPALVVTPAEPIVWIITAGPGPYYPPGDLTLDWQVNGADIQPFMSCATGWASGPLGDFTGDGRTTVDDVPGFIARLLAGEAKKGAP